MLNWIFYSVSAIYYVLSFVREILHKTEAMVSELHYLKSR